MNNAYQLNDIIFSYNKLQALSIKSLDIHAHKITALIGPNGCGKTTLLNLLAFLTENQQGKMRFFSEQVSRKYFHRFIQKISFLPQQPYLLRGSVADNLALTLKFHQQNNKQKKIINVLEQLEIEHLRFKEVKTLSGGEQQKVALARAIITDPDVLLMDEPFSYLDHCSEKLLESFIKGYTKQAHKTIVFSSHNRLQGIAIADNVISLIHGKVVNSPLINLFQGVVKQLIFDTGKIKIILPVVSLDFQYVSIDPSKISLSVTRPTAEINNQYQGRVTAMVDEQEQIRVSVSAGELFQVILSVAQFKALDISLSDQVWVAFQPCCVSVF
ncbi:MAG: ABC transporter ATP-binding protein [Methylococcales bacterium]